MAIPSKYADRSLYHFTHINNLPNIIKYGLLSKNEKNRIGIVHTDIAHESIQDRRSTMKVPCGDGGVVHDYVPLYFCKRSPMLYVVDKQYSNEKNIIYLEFPIHILETCNGVFTNFSANASIAPDFFDDTFVLPILNWAAIDAYNWGKRDDPSGNTMKEKQAEALFYKPLPLNQLKKIVVYDEQCKQKVERIFAAYDTGSPTIEIGDSSYYFNKRIQIS